MVVMMGWIIYLGEGASRRVGLHIGSTHLLFLFPSATRRGVR